MDRMMTPYTKLNKEKVFLNQFISDEDSVVGDFYSEKSEVKLRFELFSWLANEYANNNLIISCTASDNIAITSVTLFYRTVGETNWKSLPMVKNNNRYSATIFGYDVQMEGLEYYIAASDGVNTITRGSSDDPYVVVIKDASLLNDLGDVDGDGEITTKDALMIIKAINNEIILSDDQFRRADLNKDNTLSTFEALRILQYINGNVNTLEM